MSTDTPGNPAARELGYCPCCGYLTLSEGTPGSREVCPVCRWRDDPVQFANATHAGGANDVSLREARENVRRFGAASEAVEEQARDPSPEETRDPNWPY